MARPEKRSAGLGGHGVAPGEGKAQVEALDDVVADATAAEVLLADGQTVNVVLQYLVEVVGGPLVDHEHGLTVGLLFLLLVGQLALLYLYAVLLGQPAQRLGVRYLLVLHQDVDGLAALAARKALAYLAGGRNHEGRRFVVVKRTQALVVHARLAKGHELTHHVNDIGGVHNAVYCSTVYHNCRQRYKEKTE